MNHLKLVMVGERSVGKTALLARMNRDVFTSVYDATPRFDWAILRHNGASLDVSDLSGDEQLQRIVHSQIRCANIVLLCLDCSRPEAVDQLAEYLERMRDMSSDIKVIVVATKVDIANSVDEKVFSRLTQKIEHEARCFGGPILTSAKDSTGIDSLKESIFAIAVSLSQQKRHDVSSTDTEEDDQRQASLTEFPQVSSDENGCSAGFFFQVAQHPATGVIGGLLMLAGLIALGIGIACLCPALVPVLAGVGLALSESIATSLVIAGGCATVVGTIATFFHKHVTDTRVAGVAFEDNAPATCPNDFFPERPGAFYIGASS